MAFNVAVATRSSGACWILLEGQGHQVRDVHEQKEADDDGRCERE